LHFSANYILKAFYVIGGDFLNDDNIIKMIRYGKDDALIYIIEEYSKLLWVIVGGVLNNIGTVEDIEECISDTFMNLWYKPKAYDPKKGSLKTFLAIIAKRRALDKYRQIAKMKIIELDEVINKPDEDLFEYIVKRDLYSELYEAVRLLKEPDKEIIIRRYFYDEKPIDISIKIQMPVKDVKNRLYQSKIRLRKVLSKGSFGYET
jgi:RNA polymerase sigma-70 factor (ECF subfamily)